jgi:hypothetical protein
VGTVLVTPRQVIVSLIPVVASGRAPRDSAAPGRPWLPQQLNDQEAERRTDPCVPGLEQRYTL